MTKQVVNQDPNCHKIAEGLIRQLPTHHDGRNTWLLNFGKSDEAFRIKIRWIVESNSLTNNQKIDKIVELVHPPVENGCSVLTDQKS